MGIADRFSNLIDINEIEWKTLINLSNSIMGFPILAIPYCFSQVSKIHRFNIRIQ